MKSLLLTFLLVSVLATVLLAQTGNEAQPPARQPVLIEPMLAEATQLLKAERFQEAYRLARQARQMAQRRKLKGREAHAANLMALAAMSGGRITEAITLFKESSALSSAAGSDEWGKMEVLALDRAGRLARIAGRYEDALWCLQQAAQLHRQRRNRLGEALVLSYLSAVYADIGDFSNATRTIEDSLTLARSLRDQPLEKVLLLRFMMIEKGQGNFAKALEYGEKALAIEPPRLPDPNNKQPLILRVELQYNLGLVYAALNQHPKAIELYQLALQSARELHVPQVQAFALGEMAWSQFKADAATTALETVNQAVATLRQGGGNKHFEARLLFIRAEAQRAVGRNVLALTSYRQAIAALEQARALSIPTEIGRAGIVASRHQVFASAIDFLLSQQLTAEALEVAEAYHARAFLDVLAETGIEATQERTEAQRTEEEQLFAQVASVQKELWNPDLKPEDEAQLNRKLEAAEAALETFRLKLRRANPQFARLESSPLIKPDRLSQDLLDPDTALLEFVLGEQKSFAWIVHRDKLVSVTLPPRAEIEAMMTEYREVFAGKINSLTVLDAITKQKKQGQQLYQKLFQPLATHLTTAHKLVIVPDGALVYLPFETLVSASKNVTTYLLERFSISYAPSASALAALRVQRQNAVATKGIIAFGDPVYSQTAEGQQTHTRGPELRQLPYTRLEVNDLTALFPATDRRVFLGAEAQEQKVKSENLSGYRYVHFAAHGLIDEDHPARSGIALTPVADTNEDGVLQMSEVMRLKLNADLVTLSACRTGLGKLLNGEGMIGLTRSFLYAGADSVSVSLWSVNDMATASLMKSFYQNLQKGLAKDEALRQAKLALLKGTQRTWRHPYYWAAFILVGNQ